MTSMEMLTLRWILEIPCDCTLQFRRFSHKFQTLVILNGLLRDGTDLHLPLFWKGWKKFGIKEHQSSSFTGFWLYFGAQMKQF